MSFITTLSFRDLERLRKVVRKVHMAHYREDQVSDYECDRIIDALGPQVLEWDLKRLVDGKEMIPTS